MSVARIRGFLLVAPKPSAIRVTSGDGEPQMIKLGKSWAVTAATIDALNVDLIEVVDASGQILRAMRMTGPEAQRSEAASIPVGIHADPNALMITHFANLLHRAYEHSTEIAFNKLVDVMERMGDRSEAIEQRLERAEAANRRLTQEQVDDAFERAEEVAAEKSDSGDLLQQLAGAFMQGSGAGAGAKQTNLNGASKKGPS